MTDQELKAIIVLLMEKKRDEIYTHLTSNFTKEELLILTSNAEILKLKLENLSDELKVEIYNNLCLKHMRYNWDLDVLLKETEHLKKGMKLLCINLIK